MYSWKARDVCSAGYLLTLICVFALLFGAVTVDNFWPCSLVAANFWEAPKSCGNAETDLL